MLYHQKSCLQWKGTGERCLSLHPCPGTRTGVVTTAGRVRGGGKGAATVTATAGQDLEGRRSVVPGSLAWIILPCSSCAKVKLPAVPSQALQPSQLLLLLSLSPPSSPDNAGNDSAGGKLGASAQRS